MVIRAGDPVHDGIRVAKPLERTGREDDLDRRSATKKLR